MSNTFTCMSSPVRILFQSNDTHRAFLPTYSDAKTSSASLAHYAISVRVMHELVCRVSSADRRNSVFAHLRAGDAPVPVVVPQFQRVRRGGTHRRRRYGRGRVGEYHLHRRASGQDRVERSASRRSIVRPYFCLTLATRSANQHLLRSGSHSAASFATFRWRFTLGAARVRLRRSDANRFRVAESAGTVRCRVPRSA